MGKEAEKKTPGRKKRTPIDNLRTKLWFGCIRRQIFYGSLSKTVKELEFGVRIDAERLLYKYAKGQHSPSALSLGLFEKSCRGSRTIFEKGFCNLFPVLDASNFRQAVRLLTEAVSHEHEAMPDSMCLGETTLDRLQNASEVLVKRALQESRLLPLALVAGIIEARFLDKVGNLTLITPAALNKLCQAYPGLTSADVVAAIPEVAEALERHEQWERIDHCLYSPPSPEPLLEPDPISDMLVDFFERNGQLGHGLQYQQFIKLMSRMNETAEVPKP